MIFNGISDFALALFKTAQLFKAVGKITNSLVVQCAVHLLAVTGDKGHGVPLVQKVDDILHVLFFYA